MKKRFKLYLLFVLLASLVLTAFVPQTAAGEMAEVVEAMAFRWGQLASIWR